MNRGNLAKRFVISMGILAGCASMVPGQDVVPTAANVPATGEPAAIINGNVITMGELDGVFQQANSAPTKVPDTAVKQMKMQILGMMIDDILMRQFLDKNGPQVTQAEVDATMAEFVAELKKQNKTIEAYCKETAQTEAMIREDAMRLVQWNKYAATRISEDYLQKYHAAYREFFEGVTVRTSHILIPVPPTMPAPEQAQLKAQVEQLRAQITAGKTTFEDAAKTYSKCESAAKGGDIGFIPRKFGVDEPFAQAAFALPIGQISEVVQTPVGFHIIKVTERKAGQPAPYEQVKQAVHACCLQELQQSVLAHMRKTSKVQVNLR